MSAIQEAGKIGIEVVPLVKEGVIARSHKKKVGDVNAIRVEAVGLENESIKKEILNSEAHPGYARRITEVIVR